MPERPVDEALERSTTRWIAAGIGLTALFVLMFPVYRLYEPTGRSQARAELESSLASQGAGLFQTTCASCHGADGQGIDAPALNSQQFLQAADDAQIASLVAHGIPGSEMSAYSLDFGGPLTSQQIDALTSYLRSLEPNAPDRPDWRTATADAGHDEEPTAHDEEPTAHDEEPTAHDEEPTAHDEEPTAHDEEPTAHDEEPTAHDEGGG